MVTITLGGFKNKAGAPLTATVDGSTWACEDESLLGLLQTFTHGPFGPSGSDPNPDHTLARKAVEVIGNGSEITKVTPRPGDHKIPANAIF